MISWTLVVTGCGAGVVDVGIVDPKGAKNSVRPVITKKSADLWYVEYTALIPGLHSVNVFFAGKQINNSPFAVGVAAGLFVSLFVCLPFVVLSTTRVEGPS